MAIRKKTKPANTEPPSISGTGLIGQSLAGSDGIWAGVPAPVLSRNWQRNGADIPGATAPDYMLAAADDGASIQMRVTGSNESGSTTVYSAEIKAHHAPPRAVAILPDEIFDAGTGIARIETAGAFEGESLTYSLVAAPAAVTIDPRTGAISVDTDVSGGLSATLTVHAGNSGGTAETGIALTVEAEEEGGEAEEVAPVPFNPADRHPDVSLAAEDLCAWNALNTTGGVRAMKFVAAGRWYFEVSVAPGHVVSTAYIGVSNAIELLSRGASSSSPTANITFMRRDGAIGAPEGHGAGLACGWAGSVGDVVRVAVDMEARRIYFGNSTGWTGDPAMGTGGFALPLGDLAVHVNPRGTVAVPFTLCSRGLDFAFAAPPNFEPLAEMRTRLEEQLPVPSDDFVEAIAINAHLNWRDTVWADPTWRERLLGLGVRYIRTMLGTSNAARDDLAYLHEQGGIRACVLVSPFSVADGISPVFDYARIQRYLDFIRDQVGTDKIIAIEGPNEPNNRDRTDGWEDRTRSHQAWLFDAVHADPALKHLPVVGLSIYRRDPVDYATIGTVSSMVDVANLHYYTNGSKPTVGLRGTEVVPMEEVLQDARAMCPGKPLWVTEYGHNTQDDPAALTAFHVPPTVVAKYGLRGIAEFFRRGIRHIQWYSLIDDYGMPPDQFGLLAKTATRYLEPRPAYYALRRLIALMSDPGEAFQARPLEYRLSGDLTDIGHLVFQKRDGRYLLMIWQDATCWDRVALKEITAAPRSVTLTLGSAAAAIDAYHPTFGEQATPLARGSATAQIAVPDHVTVLEIRP